MLTGRRAFEGGDISEVMAGVITSQPDWDALPTALPPALVTYLRRCLQKDPRERIRDIGDMRLALAGAFDPSARPPVEPPVTTVVVPHLPLWQRPLLSPQLCWGPSCWAGSLTELLSPPHPRTVCEGRVA